MTNEVEVDTPENALAPIDVTWDGITILVIRVLLKDDFPMVVNPVVGSEIDVNPLQSRNALSFTSVTEDGMDTEVIAFFPENAPGSISVTLYVVLESVTVERMLTEPEAADTELIAAVLALDMPTIRYVMLLETFAGMLDNRVAVLPKAVRLDEFAKLNVLLL